MSQRTSIEWTEVTWNPMTGCTKISRGCDHCYAHRLAHTKTRAVYLKRLPVKDTPENRADPFAPRFWDDRLDAPLHWREPRLVFVNSMSDVFHAHFTAEQIASVFDVMRRSPRHTFQLLTKRPERARRLAPVLPWPGNLWLGTSIEDMNVAHRADTLRDVPAAVRFISAEPLLGPLTLDLTGIHWVIAGAESGPGARPMHLDWVRSLRDQCLAAGVAFFFKQSATPGGVAISLPELDGRQWKEMPLSPQSIEGET